MKFQILIKASNKYRTINNLFALELSDFCMYPAYKR